MKQFLLLVIVAVITSTCLAQESRPVDITGTVKQKLKEGLIVDDFKVSYDDIERAPKNKILLVGYSKETDVIDEDTIEFIAIRDGQFKWGGETLAKWRVVPKNP